MTPTSSSSLMHTYNSNKTFFAFECGFYFKFGEYNRNSNFIVTALERIDSSPPWKLTRRLRLHRNVLRKSRREAMKDSTVTRKSWLSRGVRDRIDHTGPVSPCRPIYINRLGLHEQRGHSRLDSLIICPHGRPSPAAGSQHASQSLNERIGEFPECIDKNSFLPLWPIEYIACITMFYSRAARLWQKKITITIMSGPYDQNCIWVIYLKIVMYFIFCK